MIAHKSTFGKISDPNKWLQSSIGREKIRQQKTTIKHGDVDMNTLYYNKISKEYGAAQSRQ